MKKYLVLALIVLVSSIIMSGCGKKNQPMDLYDMIMDRGKIVVGVKTDTKPFGFLNEEGLHDGYDIDLAKNIAKVIFGDEKAVEFIPVTPSNRIMILNSGQADMIIASMTITAQRAAVVDFSLPYHYAGQTLLLNKDSKISSLSDSKLKKVGVLFGSTAEKTIRIAVPHCLITGYKTYTDAVKALKNHEVDAIATDDTIILGIIMDDKSLKILEAPRYSKEPYGIAFRKGEETKRLRTIVDKAITDMSNEGVLNKLNKKWLK